MDVRQLVSNTPADTSLSLFLLLQKVEIPITRVGTSPACSINLTQKLYVVRADLPYVSIVMAVPLKHIGCSWSTTEPATSVSRYFYIHMAHMGMEQLALADYVCGLANLSALALPWQA